MRKLVYLVILINLTEVAYSQNKCIPFLLYKKEGTGCIYIKDTCVDDTLQILLYTTLIFKDTLAFPDPVVKSVHLDKLRIYSDPDSHSFYSLLDTDSIRSPFNQYIWDLCSAKFTYWYKNQPYKGWLEGRLEPGFKLYMGGVFYIVPDLPQHIGPDNKLNLEYQ